MLSTGDRSRLTMAGTAPSSTLRTCACAWHGGAHVGRPLRARARRH
jgi:hypothetical protein